MNARTRQESPRYAQGTPEDARRRKEHATTQRYCFEPLLHSLTFSFNIELWVSLTMRASVFVMCSSLLAGFPRFGPPLAGGGCYCILVVRPS